MVLKGNHAFKGQKFTRGGEEIQYEAAEEKHFVHGGECIDNISAELTTLRRANPQSGRAFS